jgi:hypothetical protein
MPHFLQGDIFQTAIENQHDLAVVFGHLGFNQMGPTWRAFRDHVPVLANIRDPFNQLVGQPHPIRTHQWIWFIPEERNHGMTDSTLTDVVKEVMEWAEARGIRTVITNGIADVDHGSKGL